MTNQELFEALHKSQIKAKRLMRKNKKLKRRFNKLNRALDKACEILEARDIEKSDKEGTKINLKHWWKEDLMNNEVIENDNKSNTFYHN